MQMIMIDSVCALTALLFIIGNILSFTYGHRLFHHNHYDYDSMIAMDSDHIKDEWTYRRDSNHRIHITSDLINALAWCLFIVPVLRCALLNSLHGTRQIAMNMTIAVLALAGCFMEMIATLLHLGIINTAQWLANTVNLDKWHEATENDDYLGWKTLELVHTVGRGMLLWVDAMEWIFLAVVFVLFYVSVLRQHRPQRVLTMTWATYGLIPAALCILNFFGDLGKYSPWRTYFQLLMVISYVNRLVLFPAWLIWLGTQLPKAEQSVVAMYAYAINVPGKGNNVHQQEQQNSSNVETNNVVASEGTDPSGFTEEPLA